MATPTDTDTRGLVIGAGGQLGNELVAALAARTGRASIVATDLKANPSTGILPLDVTDRAALAQLVADYKITHIYHLAAILSAVGEKNPALAWKVNMDGLLNVLNVAVEMGVQQVFWPSTIAAFGPGTPRENTPQHCVMDPTTIYGISKLAGEHLCAWYHRNHGLDVRSLRYPGLISWKTQPGGGTTDYAVHIYFDAVRKGSYTSFLKQGTRLPMMYMPDAVKATLALMDVPANRISIRTSYNLTGMTFAPEDVAAAIQQRLPGFSMDYAPDFRQAIADNWPASIDDSTARTDWGWLPDYDLDRMTDDMLLNISAPVAV